MTFNEMQIILWLNSYWWATLKISSIVLGVSILYKAVDNGRKKWLS
jgi:hypothetical protein